MDADGGRQYVPNSEPSRILRSDGKGPKFFFAGKANWIKNKMVAALNAATKNEDAALEELVQNYFSRAHSYREDIDSGCEHLGFVDSDGRLRTLATGLSMRVKDTETQTRVCLAQFSSLRFWGKGP